jgi:hypothetical protein
MTRFLTHRDSREEGFALITTMLAIFVATMIATSMMYLSFHDSTAGAQNRSWGQAIHVAESGMHEAIAYLQANNGAVPPGTVTGTTADGAYEYKVTALPRNRYQIDSIGSSGKAVSLSAARRIRVTLAPPHSFQYALFSLSDVTTKNNNLVCGDVWANTDVTVFQNDQIVAGTDPQCPSGSIGSGSATAAGGTITLQHNSLVEGDAWSGGSDSSGDAISLAGGAKVGGFAKASSGTPGCADDPGHSGYKINNGGTIVGPSTAWGTIGGGGSFSTQSPMTCTAAAAAKPIPTFNYNAANYPGPNLHEYTFPTDYAAFNAYISANQNNLQGTFHIIGGDASTPVNLSGVQIAGDTTIIADSAPIDASGGIGAANNSSKLLVLASFYAAPPTSCTTNGGNPGDCAIGLKNNFQPASGSLTGGNNTAVLLYAPNGPVAFKNNAQFQGAVYANNIQLKNNMDVVYDSRVDQIVGFGPETLVVDQWLECSSAGSLTTTDC